MNICEKMKKYDQDWKMKASTVGISESEYTLNDIYRGLVRDNILLKVLLVTRVKGDDVFLLDPTLDEVNVVKSEIKVSIDDLITEGKEDIGVGSFVVTLMYESDETINETISNINNVDISKAVILKSSAYDEAFSKNIFNFIEGVAGLLG